MKLFKCYQCVGPNGSHGVDFFAKEPVCPTCKIDGREKRFAARVVRCKIIHFDPPHAVVAEAGQNVLACDPSKRIGVADAMATGEPDVVNCPACRATDAWKAAKQHRDDGVDVVQLEQGGLASDVLASASA